jgi:hypothetical protein
MIRKEIPKLLSLNMIKRDNKKLLMYLKALSKKIKKFLLQSIKKDQHQWEIKHNFTKFMEKK